MSFVPVSLGGKEKGAQGTGSESSGLMFHVYIYIYIYSLIADSSVRVLMVVKRKTI